MTNVFFSVFCFLSTLGSLHSLFFFLEAFGYPYLVLKSFILFFLPLLDHFAAILLLSSGGH